MGDRIGSILCCDSYGDIRRHCVPSTEEWIQNVTCKCILVYSITSNHCRSFKWNDSSDSEDDELADNAKEVSESICHGCMNGAIQSFYRIPMCP